MCCILEPGQAEGHGTWDAGSHCPCREPAGEAAGPAGPTGLTGGHGYGDSVLLVGALHGCLRHPIHREAEPQWHLPWACILVIQRWTQDWGVLSHRAVSSALAMGSRLHGQEHSSKPSPCVECPLLRGPPADSSRLGGGLLSPDCLLDCCQGCGARASGSW